jgi:uncharacterized protein (DUF2147 family)
MRKSPRNFGFKIAAASVIAASLITASLAGQTNAQGITRDISGRWASQGFSSIVDFHGCANDPRKLCGTVKWLWVADNEGGGHRTDFNNPNRSLRSRQVVGLDIIQNFENTAPNVWTGGTLYNPIDGRTFTGTIRLERGVLRLRGCAMGFCKTQIWRRPEDLIAAARGNF